MTQLSIRPTESREPATLDPRLRQAVHQLVSGSYRVSGGPLVLLPGRHIAPALRADLEARLAELDRSLRHRDDEAVRIAVTGLTMTFGSARLDSDDDTETIVDMSVRALGDLPAWAVIKTIEALGRPTDGRKHEFAPSAATIHSLTARRCRVIEDERRELRAILDAETDHGPRETREQRSRVERLMADLSARMRAQATSEPVSP